MQKQHGGHYLVYQSKMNFKNPQFREAVLSVSKQSDLSKKKVITLEVPPS